MSIEITFKSKHPEHDTQTNTKFGNGGELVAAIRSSGEKINAHLTETLEKIGTLQPKAHKKIKPNEDNQ